MVFAVEAGRLDRVLSLCRASGPHRGKFAHDPAPTTDSWVATPLQKLDGRTPREAARADVSYEMLLESMLRKFEYQAALALPGEDVVEVPALRRTLSVGTAD